MPVTQPFTRTASFELISRFLYRSISTLSPPNANTVRMPLSTSSATFAAAEYAFCSLAEKYAWNCRKTQLIL